MCQGLGVVRNTLKFKKSLIKKRKQSTLTHPILFLSMFMQTENASGAQHNATKYKKHDEDKSVALFYGSSHLDQSPSPQLRWANASMTSMAKAFKSSYNTRNVQK